MLERLAVLSRHLTAPAQDEQQQQKAAAMAPTSSPSAQQLSAFCPRELAKFMTHDNHELRERIREFLKVSLRFCSGAPGARTETRTNGCGSGGSSRLGWDALSLARTFEGET